MPIEFFNSERGPSVRQSFDSPTVYLDHWAIRLFSDDRALQDRLVTSLLAKGGTILLSHISMAEFAAATDPRHCTDAEVFLERLLPNVFLTDFRFDEALNRESAEPNNLKRFWPTADLPQLKLFAERAPSSPLGFTMHGFISMAHQHRDGIGQLVDGLVSKVSAALESARHDKNYVDKARRVMPSDKRCRTLLIMGELMRDFTLDSNRPIYRNDVIDLIHAAMPLNCCDYVLLDGPWAERVAQMKQRIAKTTMTMPLATCFSQRDNGVSKFLADLESFDPQEQIANRPVP